MNCQTSAFFNYKGFSGTLLLVSDDCYCTVTGIFAPDITSFCNSISVAVYMKVSGTLVDASNRKEDMTAVSYHCYVCLRVHVHILLGQESITDTSKYAHYMATTCLSLIFPTWLSQEHACLTMKPLNLTVPAHLCCTDTSDMALAVTTCHRQTTRWKQSRTAMSL